MAIFRDAIEKLIQNTSEVEPLYLRYNLSLNLYNSLTSKAKELKKIEDLKALSVQEIESLYFTDIWLKNKYYLLQSDSLASLVFFSSIYLSCTLSNIYLQQTLQEVATQKVDVFPILSEEIIAKINSLKEYENTIITIYKNKLNKYLKSLIKVKESKKEQDKLLKCLLIINGSYLLQVGTPQYNQNKIYTT